MGDISKNFSRWEFECRCGCGFAKVSEDLVTGLQTLRDWVGKPIRVNSGCRCEKHNSAVGGELRSRHLLGEAADIWVPGLRPFELARKAAEIPVFQRGGIGVYHSEGFVHVDVRRGPARWGRTCRTSGIVTYNEEWHVKDVVNP